METEIAAHAVNFMAKYPQVGTVLMIVGTLRLIFKPLTTFLHQVVDATPTVRDNEILDRIEKSKAFKVVAWALDYFASVKLPGQILPQKTK